MKSFLEYLLEKEETKQKDLVEIASKEDLSKLNNDRYLKTLIGFLLRKVEELSKSTFVGISVDRNLRQTSHTAKYGYKTAIKLKTINRKTREDLATNILDVFKEGPLFVGDPTTTKKVEFVWFGNEDWIEKYLAKNSIKRFERGKKMLNNLVKAGSSNSRYSIAYFSIEPSAGEIKPTLEILQGLFDPDSIKDKPKFWEQHLKEAKSVKKELLNVKAECIVDFTVTTTSQMFESKVKNTNVLLDAVDFGATVRRGYYHKIAYKTPRVNLTGFVRAINNAAKAKKVTILDAALYGAIFSSISEQISSNKTFDLNKLKESTISLKQSIKNVIGKEELSKFPESITFEDALQMKHYGVVISETLIPFLLLCGYTKLKTVSGSEEKIISALEEGYKVKSVEIPESSNNPLTDYDAILVDAESADKKTMKRFAISAKFGENFNHSSLLGLIAKKKTDTDLNKFCNDFKIVYTIAKRTQKDLLGSEEKVNTTHIGDVITISNELKLQENNSELAKKLKSTNVESIQAVYLDKALVDRFNDNADFLENTYDFVFGYYGKDTTFEQIELKEDMTLKHIVKNTDDNVEISKKIALKSVASISEDKTFGRVNQPLAIELK